jgi:hypothetical protein
MVSSHVLAKSSGNDQCDVNDEDRDLKIKTQSAMKSHAASSPTMWETVQGLFAWNSHAMLHCQKKNDATRFICPWNNIVGCKQTFKTRELAANHFKAYTSDARTPIHAIDCAGSGFPITTFLQHMMTRGEGQEEEEKRAASSDSNPSSGRHAFFIDCCPNLKQSGKSMVPGR